MAMSNAERQKKFREARRTKGLIRRDEWTNREGLIAPPAKTGAWAQMTLKELEKEIVKLSERYDGMERDVFYAEIFEYAKRVEKVFTPIFEKFRELDRKVAKK